MVAAAAAVAVAAVVVMGDLVTLLALTATCQHAVRCSEGGVGGRKRREAGKKRGERRRVVFSLSLSFTLLSCMASLLPFPAPIPPRSFFLPLIDNLIDLSPNDDDDCGHE